MSADTAHATIREIGSVHDPAWEGWKSIYYDSFPENERMTEGYFLRLLEKKEAGGAPFPCILTLSPRSEPEPILGMACYELDGDLQAGFLWYLATRQEFRNRGYGSILYTDILRRLKEQGATLLLFEVEIPDHARQEEEQRGVWAERRIAWYRRQGASLLGGVQYFQSVDAPVDPTEMYVMAHPFERMTADQVFAVATQMFEDAITQTGPLTLE